MGLVIINGYLKGEALPMTNNMVTNPLLYVHFRSFGFLHLYRSFLDPVSEISEENLYLINYVSFLGQYERFSTLNSHSLP